MADRLPHESTSESSTSTWVILAALLILSSLVGVGALTLLNTVQQAQAPTGSQTAPAK